MCQHNMLQQNKHRKLSPKQAAVNPRKFLCVDVIGPCMLKGNNKIGFKVMCVSIVNPALDMLEIKKILTVASMDRK